MRKLIIEFSLINESKQRTNEEILKEISAVFFNEEITLPWIKKVEKIIIKPIKNL